jgi:hypothetical protein
MASAARTVIPRPAPRSPLPPRPPASESGPRVVSLSASEIELEADEAPPASAPPPLPSQRAPASTQPASAIVARRPSAAPPATPTWIAALPNLPGAPPSSITPPAPMSVAPAASIAAPSVTVPERPKIAPGPPSIPGVGSEPAEGAAPPPTLVSPELRPILVPVIPEGARRMRGDELATAMFEHLHALAFLPDALEAARYCLAVLAETTPCRAALVHFFDVVRHEFIVVDARGEGADDMRLKRHGINDPLLRVAMPMGSAFFWNDLSNAPARSVARFAALGQVRRALVCPISHGGRWLGAIELVDPLDGQPFDSPEEGAVSYMAKHFAEFLSGHGVIVDVATIARFAFVAEE